MLMLATRKCIYCWKKDLMKEPSIISAELILGGEGAAGYQEDFLAGDERSAAINSVLPQGWRCVPRGTIFVKIPKSLTFKKGQSSRSMWELVGSFRWSCQAGINLRSSERELRCGKRDLNPRLTLSCPTATKSEPGVFQLIMELGVRTHLNTLVDALTSNPGSLTLLEQSFAPTMYPPNGIKQLN